ncbi:MAG: hypothetical protein KA715_09545 [Xanthomonadaceae bacterium]|nr:hypothetical protein [Xanthomonadaceae bacterium]
MTKSDWFSPELILGTKTSFFSLPRHQAARVNGVCIIPIKTIDEWTSLDDLSSSPQFPNKEQLLQQPLDGLNSHSWMAISSDLYVAGLKLVELVKEIHS